MIILWFDVDFVNGNPTPINRKLVRLLGHLKGTQQPRAAPCPHLPGRIESDRALKTTISRSGTKCEKQLQATIHLSCSRLQLGRVVFSPWQQNN